MNVLSKNVLFKRVACSLLAVAGAIALYGPVRAATASWDDFAHGTLPNSGYPGSTGNYVGERVQCTMTDFTCWVGSDFHCDLIGDVNGGPVPSYVFANINGQGSYVSPDAPSLVIWNNLQTGSTYDCYCICDGGDSSNVRWFASTGGANSNVSF